MTFTRMLMTLATRGRALFESELPPALAPARVPTCRCAGGCRCGGLVPSVLLRQIEMECEFYRREM